MFQQTASMNGSVRPIRVRKSTGRRSSLTSIVAPYYAARLRHKINTGKEIEAIRTRAYA